MIKQSIWLITANGVPVEAYEQEDTAKAVVTAWRKNSTHLVEVECHRVAFYHQHQADHSLDSLSYDSRTVVKNPR